MPDRQDRQHRPGPPTPAATVRNTRHRLHTGNSQPVTGAGTGLLATHAGRQPGQAALDAGCQTGARARRPSRRSPDALAMDVSRAAPSPARQQRHHAGLHHAQHDVDARAVPRSLAPGAFDLIPGRDTPPHPDPEQFPLDARRRPAPTRRPAVTAPANARAPAAAPWPAGPARQQTRAPGAGRAARRNHPVNGTPACPVPGHSTETPRG
ncbi:hypothetical protein [Streptomyces sp. NPDC059786]|uniref:hypothetical protein n=1 Tax=Streptomyces sp. NPDC059786 TaxID=3346946 RepID=UPI0036599518